MYLYIGHKTVINSDEVIGIFDIDTATVSKRTREFLNKNEKKNSIILVSEEIPLSFVVCDNEKIYFSPVSTGTLNKRAEENFK